MTRVLVKDRPKAAVRPPRRKDAVAVLPPGGPYDLPGRGAPYVRFVAGPAGAPPVVLLHGLTGTADQTWAAAYRAISRHFPVVALDLRGHGQGIPPGSGYRLEDCADDVAALIELLALGPAIAVGYSMGGAVAQLLWRHHPELVSGLVLCSTAANFTVGPVERVAAMATVATAAALHAVPPFMRLGFDLATFLSTRDVDDPARQWLNGDYGRCTFDTFVSAASAIARFDAREWLPAVDVPTAVIVTAQDRLIPPARQRELAALIPGSTHTEVEGHHGSFVTAAERFVPPLLASCQAVAGI